MASLAEDTQEIAPAAQPQTFTASAPVPMPSLSTEGYTRREIVEGDTVYSMARNLCADVSEIQQINGLNASFNIKLGDTIQLPASRC